MKAIVLQMMVLVAIAAVAGTFTYFVHPKAPALYLNQEPLAEGEVLYERITGEWGGDVLWIDARPREKFAAGHVPGAILLNEVEWTDQLWEHVETLQSTDRPVVVYCGSHACQASKKVAARLRNEMGLEDVYILRDGIRALTATGIRLVRDGE